MACIPFSAIAKRPFAACVLTCLLLALGCQKQEDIPPTHPVRGKVAYHDGTPMKGGTIQFISSSPDSSLVTSGEIDENGAFSLYTLKGKRKVAGAVEGQYEVTILPPQTEKHEPRRPISLPEPYTIKPGESILPTITLPD